MANETTLMGLLKTPSQIRKESQDRLMQESMARSQQMITRGGSTALPGIISGYGAQAAQRGAMAGAGLLRGVTGGLGQAVGGDMGQRISALGVPVEERQARMGQEAISGMKADDPASIRAAAQRLRDMGLTGAAMQLDQQAMQVEDRTQKKQLTAEQLRGAKLSNDYKKLQIDVANDEITDEDKAKQKAEEIKNNTSQWLTEQGADKLAKLVELGSIAPDKGATAWYDSQNKGVDITEIGPYTLANGTEIIGSMAKDGKLYQLTDSGWKRIPSQGVTQGAPSTQAEGEIKTGRTVGTKGQVFDIYNSSFDELVDTGYFDGGVNKIADVEAVTGIKDIDSKAGKQELYSRAESIRANNRGISEREALERALKGERVATSQQTTTQSQTQAVDPFAGATIR